MNSYVNRNTRGFTLIELLVVMLILAILMAVALPFYLNSVSDSQKKTCRANLQTIAGAVNATRVKTIASDFAAIIASGVNSTNLPDIPAIPICPTAGTYSLANGSSGDVTTFKVLCTNHGSYEPGLDST